MALRILRIAHLRGRPPGLAGGMSGARISHSWSERSLGYRHRDENIKGLQKPAMLLIKPHYLPSRTASSGIERFEYVIRRDVLAVDVVQGAAVCLGHHGEAPVLLLVGAGFDLGLYQGVAYDTDAVGVG